jgi:hypothetical protein
MAVLRKQGVAPKDDGFVFLPPEAFYLWEAWEELHATRSSGMASNPITWTEIYAYQRCTGDRLIHWEARAVRAIDDAYMAAVAEVATDEGGG